MERLRRLVLGALAALLSWLGRQGTRAVAALIVVGIVAPSIGALLKPFVTEAVFALLCIAFLRVDAAAFRIYFGRPTIVLAATAWTSLVIPTLFGASYLAFGLKDQSSDLFLALVLQAIASPLMAAPALAALMGLDATLVLCTMVSSTALLPFTAPLFAYAFLGSALTLSPSVLGLKLFAILAGSSLVGFTVRRIAGLTAIERQKERIDGFNILVLFVFVAGVMESVAARFLATPMITSGLAALTFVVFFAVLCLTTLLFASAGRERAVTVGFMAAQRNVGLMLAATAGALPDLTWLYFAFCYLPICLSPLLLQPLTRRIIARAQRTPTATRANHMTG
ncbi:MAG: Na+-dependent transporter [Candidatus Rokuibacteriota bacterium]|nr:MAG: Na+-dependent transporter [Candidatus Rokubacteria bacterium]PYN11723.1 MAG: Na+-dependent transporter [Candidatus Rokubacteria bacterium]